MRDAILPFNAMSLAFVLLQLKSVIENLLGWCDHPDPEPLTDDWLIEVRREIHAAYGNAIRALGSHDDKPLFDNVAIRSVSRRLPESRSRCLELATLLHGNPALSIVKFDEWQSPRRRRLVEGIAETKD